MNLVYIDIACIYKYQAAATLVIGAELGAELVCAQCASMPISVDNAQPPLENK